MEEDSPKARVCAAISGIGLSPLEGIDVLAGAMCDLLVQVRVKKGGDTVAELLHLAEVSAATLAAVREKTADAADAFMIFTLAILQITGEGKATGASVPEWRKRSN